MKKNTIFIMGLIFVIIVGIVISSQGFTLVNKNVYLPEYFSGECVPRADNMATLDLGKISNDGEFFDCTSAGANKYVPSVNGIQCRFYVDEGFTHTAYDCPLGVRESQVSSQCAKLQGFFQVSSKENRYVINSGRQIYVNPTSFLGIGSATMTAEYPSYGLKFESPQGLDYPTTTNCIANSRDNDLKLVDKADRFEVIPDVPVNAIVGKSLASSTQLVTLDDVASGDIVFIERPGYYYNVEETYDGTLYVDTASGIKSDNDIECIPRTFGCSDDARIVKIAEQSCSDTGSLIGYSPVTGTNDELCKYECVDGKLKVTNDCIDVPKSCPSSEPVWDSTTGDCVAVEEFEPPNNNNTKINKSLLIVTLLLSFFGGIITYAATKMYAVGKFLKVTFVVLSVGVSVAIFIVIPIVWKAILDLFTIF